mmetsp:Transcript_112751/g.351577  ORF Transcript_112751/g.351577 Transcript_112751/m.351577 type:complete len:303 (-) Transcript_112751:186-1094(-)
MQGPHQAIGAPAEGRGSERCRRGARQLVVRGGVHEDACHRLALARHVRAGQQGPDHLLRVAAVQPRDHVAVMHARDADPWAEGGGALAHHGVEVHGGVDGVQDQAEAAAPVLLPVDVDMVAHSEATDHYRQGICRALATEGCQGTVEKAEPALGVVPSGVRKRAEGEHAGAASAAGEVRPSATAAKLGKASQVLGVEWVGPYTWHRQGKSCERECLILRLRAAANDAALRRGADYHSFGKLLPQGPPERRRPRPVALRKPQDAARAPSGQAVMQLPDHSRCRRLRLDLSGRKPAGSHPAFSR